jgi:hypothetical protein
MCFNRITPRRIISVEELRSTQPFMKSFPCFYGTQNFISVFLTPRHRALCSAEGIRSMFFFSKIHFNTVHLCLGLPLDSSLQIFAPKFYTHFLFPPCVWAIYSHRPRFIYTSNFWWRMQITKPLDMWFSTSSVVIPNMSVFFEILFLNSLGLLHFLHSAWWHDIFS